MGRLDRTTKWVIASVTVIVMVVYYVLDPSQHALIPCPFHAITGLSCPGCGTQRSVHALLHGDIQIAFRSNPLVFATIPLIGVHMIMKCSKKLKSGSLGPKIMITAWLGMVLFWGVFRNLSEVPNIST